MGLIFEWDDKKADLNLRKHGISFEEASTVFGDELSITIEDPLHSQNENRYILIGQSIHSKTLVVVHLEKNQFYKNHQCKKSYKKREEIL